jgi:hypothetical protein
VYVELNGKSFVRDERFKLTNSGELFDLSEAPFKEMPVTADTTDAAAIAARNTLQTVLDQHKAAPGHRIDKKAKKKQRARRKKAAAAE